MTFSFAAVERNAVNGTQVVDVSDVAHLSCSVCYFYFSSVLSLNFFQFQHNVCICYFRRYFFYCQTFVLTQFNFGFYCNVTDEFSTFAAFDVFDVQCRSRYYIQAQFFDCCHVVFGEDVVDCIFIEEAFTELFFYDFSRYFTFSETGQSDFIFVFVVSKSQTCFQYFCAYFKRKFYCCFFFADYYCVHH